VIIGTIKGLTTMQTWGG